MPLVVDRGRLIFFAHVPKTGGSSVEDYLIRRFGPLAFHEKKAIGKKHRDLVQACPQHLSARDLACLLPETLDLCFAVVRDPARRIVSEYGFQAGFSWVSRLGFGIWLRAVLTAARIEPRLYDNHIRPQGDLVPQGAEVFRLEEGFAGLIARIDAVTMTTAPEIEMGHLLQRGGAKRRLSRQDMALIVSFYAEDYRRFGYDLPDRAGLADDRLARLRDVAGAILGRALVLRQRLAWVI